MVVITPLMAPKMEDQVQIRAVDPVVVVAVANKAAALFGKSEGFKAGDPNVTPLEAAEEDDEF